MTDTTQQASTEHSNANISGEQAREPPPAELRPTQPTDVLVNGAVRSPRKRQHRANFLAPKVTIKIEDDDDDSSNQLPTGSSNGVSTTSTAAPTVKANKLVQTEDFNMERALVAIVQKRMEQYESTMWKEPAIKKCNSLHEENDALKKRTKLLEERLMLLESGGKMDTSTGNPALEGKTNTPTTSPTKTVTPPCAPPPLVRSVDDAKAAAGMDSANATAAAILRSPPTAVAAGRGQPSRRFQNRRLQHHPARQQNPPNFQPYDGASVNAAYRLPPPSSANIASQPPPYATAAMRFTQPMYMPYYAAPDPNTAAAAALLNTTVVPSNQGGLVRMAPASSLVNGQVQRPLVQLAPTDPRFRPPFPTAVPGMQITTMNNQHLQQQQLQPRPNAPTRPIAMQQASMTWPPNSAGSAPLAPPPQLPSLKASISASSSGIILTWDYEVHPKPGQRYEVECYHLFAHQAREAHVPAPTDISEWKKIGVVNALPLPMACTLTQFATGNVYHFAVLAVSLKGREGPLSNPCTIRLNLNSK